MRLPVAAKRDGTKHQLESEVSPYLCGIVLGEVDEYDSDRETREGNRCTTRARRGATVPSYSPACLQDGCWRDHAIFSIGRGNSLRSSQTRELASTSAPSFLSACREQTVASERVVHHPERIRPTNCRTAAKEPGLNRNIISKWRIASRVCVSPARSAGLGWSSDSHLRLDSVMKNSERVARRQSVERNLSLRKVRREFSRYPYHSLSGAISSVQKCASRSSSRNGRETT